MRVLLQSRLWTGLRAVILLQFFGSAGYFVLGRLHSGGYLEPHLEQGWSALDCVYMTVITISTIGYGEVFPTPPGTTMEDFHAVRLYTIILIMVAMLLVAYSVSSATAFLVDGQLQRLFARRSAMKKISRLSAHYIVCGSGVTGDVIVDELVASGHKVVVIDGDAESLADRVGRPEVIALEGDATDDETLREAGIERAAGLVSALPNDKDNLFLIVSAKQLRPDLRVGSLASDQQLTAKLRRAGADSVVAGSFIGGLRLASEMIRPAVVSFLDKMLHQDDSPVRFAQVQVGAAWAGRTIAALDPFNTEGLPVLAVKTKGSEHFKFNPRGDQVLEEGMDIVTMGKTDRVLELMKRIGDTSVPTILEPEEPLATERLKRVFGDTPGTLGAEEPPSSE